MTAACVAMLVVSLPPVLPQLYRLLDPANATKSLNQMISLLHVLGCEVSVVVKKRKAAA
jgi:hypothetical protein